MRCTKATAVTVSASLSPHIAVVGMQNVPEARLGAFASSSRAVLRASRPSPVVAHVSTQAEKQPAQLLGNPRASWPLLPTDSPACSSSLCMASDDADNEVLRES